jgi:hypothetical protein
LIVIGIQGLHPSFNFLPSKGQYAYRSIPRYDVSLLV